ncbi:sulfur carrier protein ThiS [Pseudonocardia sp. WMMC193]|uniref:sulfur carrier protein ThiS n=1 Tax=Pseudonocardia sp. WMMC193 TaxID=2911965 RepID=UPI001F0212CF|nr:sulfur carrier protein ThiS [Pseudonocardia sp. WMMC193]MCF7552797.1 sulfur carrier protein ThiS [Pseudonocardia sp. WMMC193]
MRVEINGTPHDLRADATVADALGAIDAPERGVAVAVDGTVVRRAHWGTPLHEGAAVEVLTAVQGG